MGQVTVTIADKIYRIACDDGQEDHLRSLAADVDDKIAEMRKAFGEIGDNRLTVMAAITFLDERLELRSRIARLESEVASLRAAGTRWRAPWARPRRRSPPPSWRPPTASRPWRAAWPRRRRAKAAAACGAVFVCTSLLSS